MGRHGIRDADRSRSTPSVAATTRSVTRSVPTSTDAAASRRIADRRGRTEPAPRSSGATGKIIVAAVAAGAVLPAVQALDSEVADAHTSTAGRTDLALAAADHHQAVGRGAQHGSVAAVAMPASKPGRAKTASSSASAGDATDVSSLTKAMSVDRENGPLDFGRPYSAGDDDSLDGQIAKALGLLGLPQKLAPGVKKIIMHESTGNPDAINRTDSNAAAGTPSKGLMQLIDTSFRNAVLPSLADKGIYDPVANITAGVRTMIANHGLSAVMSGGLKSSSGGYLGYGGAKLPDDGLGRVS